MSAENKALVRTFFEIQDQERRTPLELLTSDFTAHIPGSPPLDAHGFDEQEKTMFAAFPDSRHIIEDMVAEDDRVAIRMTIEATHAGDFMGTSASGNEVSIGAIGIMRVANGKIAEAWGSPDFLSLMQQISAMPSPSQAEKD